MECQTQASSLYDYVHLQPEVENRLEYHLRTGRASTRSGVETSTKTHSWDAFS
jgi:hypothetical protein